jgi:hypothetical protein
VWEEKLWPQGNFDVAAEFRCRIVGNLSGHVCTGPDDSHNSVSPFIRGAKGEEMIQYSMGSED